jgi:hypothetical protein
MTRRINKLNSLTVCFHDEVTAATRRRRDGVSRLVSRLALVSRLGLVSRLALPLVTRLAMLSLGSAHGSSLVTRLALPLVSSRPSSRPSRLDSRLASLGSPAKVGDELTVTAS